MGCASGNGTDSLARGGPFGARVMGRRCELWLAESQLDMDGKYDRIDKTITGESSHSEGRQRRQSRSPHSPPTAFGFAERLLP